MKIGVLVAMDKEMALLRDTLGEGVSAGAHTLALGRCGIGKVNAALEAADFIRRERPDLVVNTGVAGGTGHGAAILDVVGGRQVAYHDVWCGPGTVEGQADGQPRAFEAPQWVLDALPAGVKQGLIASGDRFISTAAEVEQILRACPDALACDMESAAIAHACHRAGVPFLALRVVSDTPGAAENISQYNNFWGEAPEATFGALLRLIHNLPAEVPAR